MKTSKPFSTLSYNTDDFITKLLNNQIKLGNLVSWAYVKHHPEEDETKEHLHVYLEPSTRIDTELFRKLFQELDPTNPIKKPLGVQPFRSSKFQDWYLYAVHDKAYLRSKNQNRKFTYSFEELHFSDQEYFKEQVNSIDRTKFDRTQFIISQLEQGSSLIELVKSGNIPVNQINYWRTVFDLMKEAKIKRSVRDKGYNSTDDNPF